MIQFEIQDTKKLFYEGRKLSKIMENGFTGFIQNEDVVIKDTDILRFNEMTDQLICDLDSWRIKVITHISNYEKVESTCIPEKSPESLPFDNILPF